MQSKGESTLEFEVESMETEATLWLEFPNIKEDQYRKVY